MAKKYGPTIKKLQMAINERFGYHLLVNKTQFFSDTNGKLLEMLVVKRMIWDEKKQKNKNIELFASTSDVQITLFLRDLWYELNGWTVPNDNPKWTETKQKYMERHGK